VWKDGYLWMAVQRADWWERKRLKPRQADRAIEKLEVKNLVVKAVYKFNGSPTTHLRLNVPEFFKQYGEAVEAANPPEDQSDTITKDLADLYEMMGFGNHQTVISKSPNGEAKSPNGEIINNPHQPSHTSNSALLENMPADWQAAHGLPPELAAPTERELDETAATDAFEQAFGFGALPWWTGGSTWDRMRRFVTKIHKADPQAFQKYVTWRNGAGKFSAMNNKQIRLQPQAFMDTGWSEFEQSQQPEATGEGRLLA
jgi:hypothetical protein